jgi:hypothetical protein
MSTELYDQDDAQYEAQAIIDQVSRCARGQHDPEPLLLTDYEGYYILQCSFCGVRL